VISVIRASRHPCLLHAQTTSFLPLHKQSSKHTEVSESAG
jgi:hypothetical protein